jgi:hypothetical protein
MEGLRVTVCRRRYSNREVARKAEVWAARLLSDFTADSPPVKCDPHLAAWVWW